LLSMRALIWKAQAWPKKYCWVRWKVK